MRPTLAIKCRSRIERSFCVRRRLFRIICKESIHLALKILIRSLPRKRIIVDVDPGMLGCNVIDLDTYINSIEGEVRKSVSPIRIFGESCLSYMSHLYAREVGSQRISVVLGRRLDKMTRLRTPDHPVQLGEIDETRRYAVHILSTYIMVAISKAHTWLLGTPRRRWSIHPVLRSVSQDIFD